MDMDMEIGRCDCCGEVNIPVDRIYYSYPIKCECHLPIHTDMKRICNNCKERYPDKNFIPLETKIVVKTEDLDDPINYALKILNGSVELGLYTKEEIISKLISRL